MTFASEPDTPDESSTNTPDSASSNGPSQPTERRVSVPWESAPIPLTEAVEGHARQLMSVYEEDSDLHDRLSGLEEIVEEQRETINELERVVEILAATSEVSVEAYCPECDDGVLEMKRPVMGQNHVACTECGEVAATMKR